MLRPTKAEQQAEQERLLARKVVTNVSILTVAGCKVVRGATDQDWAVVNDAYQIQLQVGTWRTIKEGGAQGQTAGSLRDHIKREAASLAAVEAALMPAETNPE